MNNYVRFWILSLALFAYPIMGAPLQEGSFDSKMHKETQRGRWIEERAGASNSLAQGRGGGHPAMALKTLRCSNGTLHAKGMCKGS